MMKKIFLLVSALIFSAPLFSMDDSSSHSDMILNHFQRDLMREVVSLAQADKNSREEKRLEQALPALAEAYPSFVKKRLNSSYTYNPIVIEYPDGRTYDFATGELYGAGVINYEEMYGKENVTKLRAEDLAELYWQEFGKYQHESVLKDLLMAFPEYPYVPQEIRAEQYALKKRNYTMLACIAGGALVTAATIIAVAYRLLHRKKAQDARQSEQAHEAVLSDDVAIAA